MKNKNIFVNIFDAIIEGRTRSAQKEINHYRRALKLEVKDTL